MNKINKNENGIIAIVVMALFVFLAMVTFSVMNYSVANYKLASKDTFNANSMQVAEAGIEQSLNSLNLNDNFTGYSSDQEFFNNTTQGKGTFTTVVANTADSNAKTITSTGKVYRKSTDATPLSTRIVKVTVVGTASEGYSVFSGPGGLILSGSASITNSDVFVNGTITMSGNSKIGTVNQPLNVNVAHQACPTGNNPGSTYAVVCSSGQPISISGSSNIYGTVCATNQTNSNKILTGNGGSGLVAGCTTPVGTQPTYDRAAHIAKMTTTGAGNSNTYVCNNSPFTRSWPANLKLTGNVSIGGSCDVTINGDVYITGDLSLGGAAKIKVGEGVGATSPKIVVDGKITVGGSAQLISNTQKAGLYFISYKSSASCNPSCTSVTGNELKTSQALETISVGGGGNSAGMVFHAYWGKVSLGGSGNIGAAVGQTVDMSGAGTVTFGTILSSGSKTWTISSYQQVFQ